MKNLLLLAIFCYSLQFTSCKTTSQAYATPNYPRFAELHHGNYGTSMYSANTAHTQAVAKIWNTYCDTVNINRPVQIAPVKPVISAAAVAIIQ